MKGIRHMVSAATIDYIPRIAEIHICGGRFAYKGIISDIDLGNLYLPLYFRYCIDS
jgi:hypothetical protein